MLKDWEKWLGQIDDNNTVVFSTSSDLKEIILNLFPHINSSDKNLTLSEFLEEKISLIKKDILKKPKNIEKEDFNWGFNWIISLKIRNWDETKFLIDNNLLNSLNVSFIIFFANYSTLYHILKEKITHKFINYINKDITWDIILKEQKDFIIIIQNLFSFLDKYSSFIFNSELNTKLNLWIFLDKDDLTLDDLDSISEILRTIASEKTINPKVKDYIFDFIEVIHYFSRSIKYIKAEEFNSKESDKLSLLAILTYSFKAKLRIKNRNIEVELLSDIIWEKTNSDFSNKFWESNIKNDLENNKKEIRDKVLIILNLRNDLLHSSSENELYSYLINQDKSKLDIIINFLKSSNEQFKHSDLLFIFKNDLEKSFLSQKKERIEKVIFREENWITIDELKNIDCFQFEVLFCIQPVLEVRRLVDKILWSNDIDIWNDYLLFLEEKKTLEENLDFLHGSFIWYKEYIELINLDFNKFNSGKQYLSIVNNTYKKYNIEETIKRNKWLLSLYDCDIDELDTYYLTFDFLEEEMKYELLEGMSSNISYLKNIFWNHEYNDIDIVRINKWWYLKKIVRNQELVGLLIEFDVEITIKEILDEIDVEEGRVPVIIKEGGNSNVIKKDLITIYWESEYKMISEIGLPTKWLEYLAKIWKLLNWNKYLFVIWLKTIQTIEIYNLENIFTSIFFLSKKWVFVFENINGFFNLCKKLPEKSEEITFLYKKFRDIWDIKDTKAFGRIIIMYLRTKDKTIIENYINDINKWDLSPKNLMDLELKRIFYEWEIDEKNKLGENLALFVNKLLNELTPISLSSTKNLNSWIWTGTATRRLRKYYLKWLSIKRWEDYIEYLERVFIINWQKISPLTLHEISWSFRLKTLFDVWTNEHNFFFEAFERFWGIISAYKEKLKIHNDEVDISNLLSRFNEIYLDLIEDFKKSNKIS